MQQIVDASPKACVRNAGSCAVARFISAACLSHREVEAHAIMHGCPHKRFVGTLPSVKPVMPMLSALTESGPARSWNALGAPSQSGEYKVSVQSDSVEILGTCAAASRCLSEESRKDDGVTGSAGSDMVSNADSTQPWFPLHQEFARRRERTDCYLQSV